MKTTITMTEGQTRVLKKGIAWIIENYNSGDRQMRQTLLRILEILMVKS